MADAGKVFSLAWRILPLLPAPIVRGGFDVVARVAHRFNLGGSTQLASNLQRVTGREGKGLRALTREGMRRYMRYYAEVFQLPRMTPAQIRARVRTINAEHVRRRLGEGAVVAGLGHAGNWDLAGAWSGENLGHVITVAEKLDPPELFQQFLDFRHGLGMKIFGFEKGKGLFKELVHAAQTHHCLMPLLCDRDLSRDGVEVTVAGHAMRVAPGPATVSLAAGVPFVGVFIRHERLTGARRRAAGSPWGIVIEFTDPFVAPAGEGAANHLMQQWADKFGDFLRTYPQDWHMLQKCFSADLDPQRLSLADGGMYGEGS